MDSPDEKGNWSPAVPIWKRLRWSAPFYVVGIVGAALISAPFLSGYAFDMAIGRGIAFLIMAGFLMLLFWIGHKIKEWLSPKAKPVASSEPDAAFAEPE